MADREVASLRVAGGFAARRLLYRALAHALVGAEPPAGAVFESTLRGPPPTIYIRPAHLLGGPGPVHLPGVRAVVGPPDRRPPEPHEGTVARYGRIVPGSEGVPPSGSPLPPSYPGLAGFLERGGWAGTQVLWSRSKRGQMLVGARMRVAATGAPALARIHDAMAARLLSDWTRATGTVAIVRPARPWARGDWRRAAARSMWPQDWYALPVDRVEETAELGFRDWVSAGSETDGHTVVLGASGTGKTTLLAHRAAHAIAHGRPVVVIDLHGDLTPAVVGALTSAQLRGLVSVDVGARPVTGIAGLVSDGREENRAAAHFVAAVKRLSPDGTDLAWGFRLERIFETFSRLTLESRGTLLDLYAFLTEPRRREAALLGAHRPETVRFLEELGPIVRRNPEFLWSAATRLSKVVLVPELAELLAPPGGGVPVEALLANRRSVLVRIPVATLGPEAAGFAATLVLGRIYLGLTATDVRDRSALPILVVLDEVQGFAPRLVAEILSDSRKFGLEALVATQYPDRMAPELRAAAAGAASTFVAFRIPPANAGQVGPWVGLSPARGNEVLASLPPGVAVVLDPREGRPRWHEGFAALGGEGGSAWEVAVARTRREFGVEPAPTETGTEEASVMRVLLAILAAEEAGRPLSPDGVVGAASAMPGPPLEPTELAGAWSRIARGPECTGAPDRVRLTAAGERRVGFAALTGAQSETGEHRALLLRAFRVFARKGYAFEILRQGRFDTTLPDGLFRHFGPPGQFVPVDLARTLDRVRTGWAWTYFGGRDVHLEAEVSGALHPDRIRRDWSKAKARGAFALFLVGDGRRARRVQTALRPLGVGSDRARIWTLGPAWDRRRSPPSREAEGVSARSD